MKKYSFLLFFLMAVTARVFSQTANPQQYKYVFTVAKDGSGDYTTIQDAIGAMRGYPLAPITLYIKNGVYKEKIVLPPNNTDVTFIGENVDSTIISFDDYSGKGNLSTFTSYTAKISGNRFTAQNITFLNTAGRVGQALALYVDADKAVFVNCKFIGNQDTIFTGGETARQLFYNCYIEGTTDFIFGPATAVFQNCTIRAKTNSYITAANTTAGKLFGYVFLDCRIIADAEVTKLFLGRPWRAYAKTVFIRCDLPSVIAPAGWDNWDNPENEKTTFYAEYKNTGAGAAVEKRAGWSHQLTAKDAKQYTLKNIFASTPVKMNSDDEWYLKTTAIPFQFPMPTRKPSETFKLYSGAIPNSIAVANIESAEKGKDGITRIANVSEPTITVYRPAKPNGQAVIICPGGGYAILAYDWEGTSIAEQLIRSGVTAFVLKYRLPNDRSNADKSLAPLQDAQQAIRFVRSRAKEFGVLPNKIGIMGFSAGGHLASTATTHFNFKADADNNDTTSVRPDFSILMYPVISMDSSITHKGSRNNLLGGNPSKEKVDFFSNELQVTADTPPVFLVHAEDDGAVPVDNSIRFYQACVKNKVPAEMHLYPKGGHGFSLYNKTTTDSWMERLQNWLMTLNK